MDSVGFAWQESEAKARKYKIHKKAQSGRSMVEMLGVLAVIGVLSVAGIAGFKTAMDKHKANELLYEASKRATMVAAQIAQGRPGDVLSLSEFPETVGDSTFSVTKTALTGKFAITMTNVDKAICQNLMNTVGDKTQVRYMAMKDTPQTKITNCNDNPANYALVFNDDLTTVDAIFDDNTPTDPTTDNSYNSCGSNSGEVCSSTDCKIDWNRYNSLCGGSSTPSSSGGSPDDVYSGCGSNSGEVCTPSGTCKTDWTIWYSMCDSAASSS